MLFIHLIGKKSLCVSWDKKGYPCGKGWCSASLVCPLYTVTMNYVISFSKRTHKKTSALKEFLHRNYEMNVVLKTHKFTKIRKYQHWHVRYSLDELLVCHTVIKTVMADKRASAKETVYRKLTSTLINNASLLSEIKFILKCLSSLPLIFLLFWMYFINIQTLGV